MPTLALYRVIKGGSTSADMLPNVFAPDGCTPVPEPVARNSLDTEVGAPTASNCGTCGTSANVPINSTDLAPDKSINGLSVEASISNVYNLDVKRCEPCMDLSDTTVRTSVNVVAMIK